MNAHRPRKPFRRGMLIRASVAPLLSLVVAAGAAPRPARPQSKGKKVEVRIASADMELCGPRRERKTGWDNLCIRGKVRTLTDEHRTARTQGGRVLEGDLYSIVRTHFDERGNQILTELSDSATGPVGVFSRRGVFSFDEAGRETGSKWYVDGKDGPQSVIVYTYDERGNRVRIDSSRTEPDARIVQEFSYDAEGREVGGSFSRLTAGGWQTQEHKTSVAVEGEMTHSRSYSTDGTLRGRVSILKDDRGNTLGEELYGVNAQGEEQLLRKVTYSYDRRGFLTEVIYHKAEEWLGARAVYVYDEMGSVTSLTRYNADGTFAVSEHCEYVYDGAGNWVKRVASNRGSENDAPAPYRVDRRHITYY